MDSSQGRLAALAFGALTLLAVGAHARPRVDLGVQNENDITINATSTDLGNGCRRICYEVTLAANAENENLLDFHVEVNSADASLFSDFDVDKKQADGTWADTHWWEGKHGSQVEGNANHHYIDFYSPYGNEKMKKGNTYRFCVTYCGAATNLDSTIEFLATNSGNALPGIPDATGNRADVPDDPNTNQDDEGWKGPWSAGTGAKVGFLLSAKSASDSSLWVAPQRGLMDAGVVISVPSGSSDYYSLAQEVKPGNGNSEQLAGEQLVAGVAVSVADFGSGLTYPMIGVFSPNLGLDPSGNTPDLVNAITAIYSPVNPAPPLLSFVGFAMPEIGIPVGATRAVAVVKLPPGDSGTLGVGVDSTNDPVGGSGFSRDGYTTPAVAAGTFDLGLSIAQDNSRTDSCRSADRKPHGRLRVSSAPVGNAGSGDHLTASVASGDVLQIAFFGTKSGDKFRLYYAAAPCTPALAIGPVLPTIPDGDGTGSYLRLNATFPSGFGGTTYRFSAVWGNPACGNPGVGFTNCVTLVTAPDRDFGVCDDGTIESGWLVQVPAGSADYFNNNFGAPPSSLGNGITNLTLAVLDFGSTTSSFPTAGISNANYAIDPLGNTPDLRGGGLLAQIAPFTFPPGTFATTSGAYVRQPVSVSRFDLGQDVHGWVQLPPGDSGLLGIGADSSSVPWGGSFQSGDGYFTPARSLPFNLGIRVRAE